MAFVPAMDDEPLQLRLGVLHDENAADVLCGARMSLHEIQRAAQLLKFEAHASEHTIAGDLPKVSGVVGAKRGADALAGIAVPVINTVAGPSGSHIWHVDHIEWDGEAEKFGAAQLNDRYRAAYKSPMTSSAWAGWFAVKVLWEAAVRSRSADPDDIQEYLLSPRAAFDGHLGRPLRFDPGTHKLL